MIPSRISKPIVTGIHSAGTPRITPYGIHDRIHSVTPTRILIA